MVFDIGPTRWCYLRSGLVVVCDDRRAPPMYIRHFGNAFCLVVEPPLVPEARNDEFEYEPAFKYEGEDEEEDEQAADDESKRWIDRWTSEDGHFLRIGRVTLIYTPRAKRRKADAEAQAPSEE